jgi:hypothetical protein
MTLPYKCASSHQAAIIRRYSTKKPKLQAAKELIVVVDLMKKTDKESFIGALQEWFYKWQWFLDERSNNTETGKTYYTHKRLRSASRSLK